MMAQGCQGSMDEQTRADRIRLILVDDQALFRASLSRYLAAQPGLEVAGECDASAEVFASAIRSSPDIVLLNLDLAAEGADELISTALRAGYKGRYLLIAGQAYGNTLEAAIKLGASGIFLRSEAPERLVQAIRLVASGAVWFDQTTIQLLAGQRVKPSQLDAPGPVSLLSDREERVLRGILSGLTNRQIGVNIGLSESSVKWVVQQLFVKTGVRSRSQLVRVALEGSLGAISAATGKARSAKSPAFSKNSDELQPENLSVTH